MTYDYPAGWTLAEVEAAMETEHGRRSVLGYISGLKYALADRNRQDQLVADLRIVVRDQRRHIENLEAQLLPYLQAPQAEQEGLAI